MKAFQDNVIGTITNLDVDFQNCMNVTNVTIAEIESRMVSTNHYAPEM